jgi:hypothetical protein
MRRACALRTLDRLKALAESLSYKDSPEPSLCLTQKLTTGFVPRVGQAVRLPSTVFVFRMGRRIACPTVKRHVIRPGHHT